MQQGQQHQQFYLKSPIISNTEPSINNSNNNTTIKTCSRTTSSTESKKCTSTGTSHCITGIGNNIDDYGGVGSTTKREQGTTPPSGTYIGTNRQPISRSELIGTMNKTPPPYLEKDLCKNQYPIEAVSHADEDNIEYYTMLDRMSSLSSLSAATSSGLVDTGNTTTRNGNTNRHNDSDKDKAMKKQPPSQQSQQRMGSFDYHYYQNTMVEQQQQEGKQKHRDLRMSIIGSNDDNESSPIIQKVQNVNNKFQQMSIQEQQEVLLQEAKNTIQNEIVAQMIQENEMIAISQIECQLQYDTQIAMRLQEEENNKKDNNTTTTITQSLSLSSSALFDTNNNHNDTTSHDLQIATILQKEIIDTEERER